mgnify:CR=1 FL=1
MDPDRDDSMTDAGANERACHYCGMGGDNVLDVPSGVACHLDDTICLAAAEARGRREMREERDRMEKALAYVVEVRPCVSPVCAAGDVDEFCCHHCAARALPDRREP